MKQKIITSLFLPGNSSHQFKKIFLDNPEYIQLPKK